jgi:hypothetical protein
VEFATGAAAHRRRIDGGDDVPKLDGSIRAPNGWAEAGSGSLRVCGYTKDKHAAVDSEVPRLYTSHAA